MKDNAYKLTEQKIADALRSGSPHPPSPKFDTKHTFENAMYSIVVFGGDARRAEGAGSCQSFNRANQG